MCFTFVIPEFSCLTTNLSNRNLLEISFLLFLIFVVSEILGAYVSNSIALFGDALSMSIDVVTYIFNIYGEYLKDNNYRNNYCSSHIINSTILIDIIIPSISLIALLIATSVMCYDAIVVLKHPPTENDVNTSYLYGYAAANLVVDGFCSYLFYLRSENVFEEYSNIPQLSIDTSISFDEENEFGNLDIDDNDDFHFSEVASSSSSLTTSGGRYYNPFGMTTLTCSTKWSQVYHSYCSSCILKLPSQCISCKSTSQSENNYRDINNTSNSNTVDNSVNSKSVVVHKNLNMMSAFTHILGDTLRTIAIFLAALISSLTSIDGDICDAWAALLVAITILILCINLFINITTAISHIYGYNNSEDQSPNNRNSNNTSRSRQIKYHNNSSSSRRSGNSHKNNSLAANTPYSRVSSIDLEEVDNDDL